MSSESIPTIGSSAPRIAPRVGRRKTRTGCRKCRTRKVKCDEERPFCRNCQRLGLDCSYPENTPLASRHASRGESAEENRSSPGSSSSLKPGRPPVPPIDGFYANAVRHAPDEEMEENRARRLMEMRLMHQWTIEVMQPFVVDNLTDFGKIWHVEIPRLALENDNLMYALLSFSATRTCRQYPDDRELLQARTKYWLMALREQRNAISDPTKAEASSFAAFLLTLNAFAMIQDRDLTPYVPPLEWLELGRGTSSVLPAPELLDLNPKLKVIVNTTAPIWQNEVPYYVDGDDPYGATLTTNLDSSELSDPEVYDVYSKTLNHIRAFRTGVRIGEPWYVHIRRTCMFPWIIPPKFVDLLREERPRALVLLACFFSAVAQSQAFRYLGGTMLGRAAMEKEVLAINDTVPEEWRTLMIRPLDETRAACRMPP